jgi:hypothetical protein
MQMDTAEIFTIPTGEPFRARTGIGRSRQFELIAKGELDSVLVGRRRLIIMKSFHRYIERLREREAAGVGRIASPNQRAGMTQRVGRESASRARERPDQTLPA